MQGRNFLLNNRSCIWGGGWTSPLTGPFWLKACGVVHPLLFFLPVGFRWDALRMAWPVELAAFDSLRASRAFFGVEGCRVDGLHSCRWGPGGRLPAPGSTAASGRGSNYRSCHPGDRRAPDSGPSRTVGAGVPSCKAETACGLRAGPSTLGGSRPMGGSTLRGAKLHHGTQGSDEGHDGTEDEVLRNFGPGGRVGVCHLVGGAETEMAGKLSFARQVDSPWSRRNHPQNKSQHC